MEAIARESILKELEDFVLVPLGEMASARKTHPLFNMPDDMLIDTLATLRGAESEMRAELSAAQAAHAKLKAFWKDDGHDLSHEWGAKAYRALVLEPHLKKAVTIRDSVRGRIGPVSLIRLFDEFGDLWD